MGKSWIEEDKAVGVEVVNVFVGKINMWDVFFFVFCFVGTFSTKIEFGIKKRNLQVDQLIFFLSGIFNIHKICIFFAIFGVLF